MNRKMAFMAQNSTFWQNIGRNKFDLDLEYIQIFSIWMIWMGKSYPNQQHMSGNIRMFLNEPNLNAH